MDDAEAVIEKEAEPAHPSSPPKETASSPVKPASVTGSSTKTAITSEAAPAPVPAVAPSSPPVVMAFTAGPTDEPGSTVTSDVYEEDDGEGSSGGSSSESESDSDTPPTKKNASPTKLALPPPPSASKKRPSRIDKIKEQRRLNALSTGARSSPSTTRGASPDYTDDVSSSSSDDELELSDLDEEEEEGRPHRRRESGLRTSFGGRLGAASSDSDDQEGVLPPGTFVRESTNEYARSSDEEWELAPSPPRDQLVAIVAATPVAAARLSSAASPPPSGQRQPIRDSDFDSHSEAGSDMSSQSAADDHDASRLVSAVPESPMATTTGVLPFIEGDGDETMLGGDEDADTDAANDEDADDEEDDEVVLEDKSPAARRLVSSASQQLPSPPRSVPASSRSHSSDGSSTAAAALPSASAPQLKQPSARRVTRASFALLDASQPPVASQRAELAVKEAHALDRVISGLPPSSQPMGEDEEAELEMPTSAQPPRREQASPTPPPASAASVIVPASSQADGDDETMPSSSYLEPSPAPPSKRRGRPSAASLLEAAATAAAPSTSPILPPSTPSSAAHSEDLSTPATASRVTRRATRSAAALEAANAAQARADKRRLEAVGATPDVASVRSIS